ncbi:MAG: pentapeptide repeat-containing protein, partial [Chloroflexota bacterium]
GTVAAIFGYIQQYVASDWLNFLDNPIADFYANASSELISIAITVLIIERASRKQSEAERKSELIFQLGSDERVTAKGALRMLRHRGWLTDGSVNGSYLRRANLAESDLSDASLAGADLWGANLNRAFLAGSNLERTNLRDVDLSDASLWRANLTGAYISNTNLSGVTLPDGKKWNENIDMSRFTDPQHPNFHWMRDIEPVQENHDS